MSDPSAEPRTPPRADRVELGLWLGLYALSFALRFLQSPAGAVADEELHTPTVAAWLSGAFRPGLLPELQYTAPCGGCTAEALAVWPLFALFGPGLVLWKLVPLGFGLVVTALLWRLARDGGGAAAARATAAAWVFAPTWVGANTLVAFGGHFEVMALVLGGLALATGATPPTPRRAAAVGLLAGLAFWFDYAAAFAAPALLGLVLWRSPARRRGLGAWAGGLGLGLLPWLATQATLSASGRLAGTSWFTAAGRGTGELVAEGPGLATRLSELLGPDLWVSMFNPLLPPDRWLAGAAVTAAGLAAVGATLWRGLRHRAPLPLTVGLLPLLYGLVYLAVAPTGMDRPAGAPLPANALRYLMPLAPLTALALGLSVRALPAGLWRAVVLVAVGTGLGFRLAEVEPGALSSRPLHLVALDRQALADRDVTGPTPDGWAGELTELAVGYQQLGGAVVEARRLRRASPDALRDPDLPDARLEGLALRLQHDGGWLEGGRPRRAPERLAGLLSATPAATGQAIATHLLRYERAPAIASAAAALDAAEDPFGEPDPWAAALAFWAGHRAADDLWERRGQPETWPDRVRAPLQALRGAARAAWLEGLGAGLGARFVHQPERVERFAAGLAAPDASALRAGAAQGRARVAW